MHAWALLLAALLQPLPLAMAADGGWAQEGWLKAVFVPALLLQVTAALLLVSLMSSVLVWRCTGNIWCGMLTHHMGPLLHTEFSSLVAVVAVWFCCCTGLVSVSWRAQTSQLQPQHVLEDTAAVGTPLSAL